MSTIYELYSDERKDQWYWLGGIVGTDKGCSRLLKGLSDVRAHYGLTAEMKWEKISRSYLNAYRAWIDVFFEDPFARYSLFQIDVSGPAWNSFRPRTDRRATLDDRLASAYHQFLLVTFLPLSDSKRWRIYPDAGYFSRDAVLGRVEFLFNRTYKRAFGPKSTRIIRFARARDSRSTDLVQLADVLLGALSFHVLNDRPESFHKAEFVNYCTDRLNSEPTTQGGLPRLSVTS